MAAMVPRPTILRRHADNELPNLGRHRQPARPATAVAVVLPGDELPMPCQEGVRAHDGSDLLEHSPPLGLRLGGQAKALIVGEAQPARSELLAEHALVHRQSRLGGLLNFHRREAWSAAHRSG
jgi:hypothetical protein